jgi:hypothetical protein
MSAPPINGEAPAVTQAQESAKIQAVGSVMSGIATVKYHGPAFCRLDCPPPKETVSKEDLVLEPMREDDRTLPKPRGRAPVKYEVNSREAKKLQQTIKKKGFLPDYGGHQFWKCTACHKIYDEKQLAEDCCGQGAAPVHGVCTQCYQRLDDCKCKKGKN